MAELQLLLHYMNIFCTGLGGWMLVCIAFMIIVTVIDTVLHLVLKIIMSVIGYVKKTKLFRKTQEIK